MRLQIWRRQSLTLRNKVHGRYAKRTTKLLYFIVGLTALIWLSIALQFSIFYAPAQAIGLIPYIYLGVTIVWISYTSYMFFQTSLEQLRIEIKLKRKETQKAESALRETQQQSERVKLQLLTKKKALAPDEERKGELYEMFENGRFEEVKHRSDLDPYMMPDESFTDACHRLSRNDQFMTAMKASFLDLESKTRGLLDEDEKLDALLSHELASYQVHHSASRQAQEQMKEDFIAQTSVVAYGSIAATVMFALSILVFVVWNPNAVSLDEASIGAVASLTLDLLLKGAFFDLFEHFDLSISRISFNSDYGWLNYYTFTFRLFSSFVILTIVRITASILSARVGDSRIVNWIKLYYHFLMPNIDNTSTTRSYVNKENIRNNLN